MKAIPVLMVYMIRVEMVESVLVKNISTLTPFKSTSPHGLKPVLLCSSTVVRRMQTSPSAAIAQPTVAKTVH